MLRICWCAAAAAEHRFLVNDTPKRRRIQKSQGISSTQNSKIACFFGNRRFLLTLSCYTRNLYSYTIMKRCVEG